MPGFHQRRLPALAAVMFLSLAAVSFGQSISGTVTDQTGAVVPNATVEIHNPVSKYDRSTSTDTSGRFSFPNNAGCASSSNHPHHCRSATKNQNENSAPPRQTETARAITDFFNTHS